MRCAVLGDPIAHSLSPVLHRAGYAAVGLDWRMIDDYPDKLKAVTAEQVQTVARKYLVDARLTVAVLDPQPIGKGQRRMPRPRGGSDVR